MEKLKKLSKAALIELTLGGWLYFVILFPELLKAKISDNRCRNIINTIRGESNASLSCYCKNGIWYLYDHADPDFSGDMFSIYSKFNDGKNFTDSMKGIYEEVTGEEAPDFKRTKNSRIEESTLAETSAYEIEKISFDQLGKKEIDFIDRFGITIDVMKKQQTAFLSSYTFESQAGKVYKISAGENDVIIGHVFNFGVKIYEPYNKDFKHRWIGIKPFGYYYGEDRIYHLVQDLENLGEEAKNKKTQIVIGAGEKDTLVLNSLGFLSLCLNSETTRYIPDLLIKKLDYVKEITGIGPEIIIIYDLDKTGIKQSEILKKNFEKKHFLTRIVTLPKKLSEKGGKDVADWISLGLPKEELIQLIKGEGKNPSPVSPVSSRTVIDSPEEKTVDNEASIEDDSDDSVDQKNESIEEESEEEEDEDPETKEPSINSIPLELYNSFPKTLQEAILPFEEQNKTMMTIAFITVIGSVFKNVVARFRKDRVYPNLYTIIVAPPASGKSLIKWARHLIMPIERFLHSESKNNLEAYNHDVSLAKADELDWAEVGDQPPFKVQLIPADITSAMWVQQISDNDGYGLMYDTEIDGLVESNNCNLRSFTDYLRKAYEGEPLSLMRKKNRERVAVEEGKMSLLLSGTPGQFLKLIPDAENGLFSRVIPLIFNGSDKWQNAFEPEQLDFECYFEQLSLKVFSFFQQLESLAEPVKFELTKQQLIHLDHEFSQRLEKIKNIIGIDGRATVLRLGAIVIKIAMILTTLRRLENDPLDNQYQCDERDFQAAMTITEVILNHVVLTLKMMKNERIEHCYRGKKLDYFYTLPDSFSYAESQQIAEQENVKLRTAQKWIYEFRNKGFLVNPEKGQFKKVV
jgi:Protein of unknown function (DUF3987)